MTGCVAISRKYRASIESPPPSSISLSDGGRRGDSGDVRSVAPSTGGTSRSNSSSMSSPSAAGVPAPIAGVSPSKSSSWGASAASGCCLACTPPRDEVLDPSLLGPPIGWSAALPRLLSWPATAAALLLLLLMTDVSSLASGWAVWAEVFDEPTADEEEDERAERFDRL